MKTLTTALGALLLAGFAAAAAPPMDSFSINFSKIEFEIADTGDSGLEPGRYELTFDRSQAAAGEGLGARLAPAGRARGGRPPAEPLEIDIPATAFSGCDAGDDATQWSFGRRSQTRVSKQPDGGRRVQIWAEGGRTCSLSFQIIAAGLDGRYGTPTRTGGSTLPVGPGGLTSEGPPPQCAPPRFPPPGGDPQPSALGPQLTVTPLSPPDAECELTALPTHSELRGLSTRVDPAAAGALQSALVALRRDVERLSKVPADDRRGVAAAKSRVRQSVANVSKLSRGSLAESAGRCEATHDACETACGGDECCCCLGSYVRCLLE